MRFVLFWGFLGSISIDFKSEIQTLGETSWKALFSHNSINKKEETSEVKAQLLW